MEAGGTPAGLQFRVKTHASIVSKLHRKAEEQFKEQNPDAKGEGYKLSALREMADEVRDGFRFTAVVPKDGYTDKADELVRIMQRNGWTVTKPKRHEFGHYTWDSYPGLNLVFEKNGENVEIQVQTPYSFVAKNATHVAYDIARDGDEENPDIIRINQDQKTIFGCVPTPKNVANKHYIENPLENREEDKKWQPGTTNETSLSSETMDKNSGVSTTQNLGTGSETNELKESTNALTTTGSRNSPKRKHSKQSPTGSKSSTGSKSGLEKRTPTSSNGTTRTKPSHVDTSQATFKEINECLGGNSRVMEYDKPATGLQNVANNHFIENPLGNREEDKKWQPSTTRETSLSSETMDKNYGVSTTQNLGTGNGQSEPRESTSAPTMTGSTNSPKRKPSKQSPKTSKNTTGSKSGLEKRTPTSSNETTRTKPSHIDTSQATFKEINERLSRRGRVTVDGVEYDKPTTGLPEAGDLVETPEGWG